MRKIYFLFVLMMLNGFAFAQVSLPYAYDFDASNTLTEEDVAELERILWSEVGTKQDYEREIGSIPLGEFVRSVIGLDMTAAKAAFAEYLDPGTVTKPSPFSAACQVLSLCT